MPAHIKSALTQTQLTIPVTDGRLQLGVWQGVFLFEHRAAPQSALVVLTLIARRTRVRVRLTLVRIAEPAPLVVPVINAAAMCRQICSTSPWTL